VAKSSEVIYTNTCYDSLNPHAHAYYNLASRSVIEDQKGFRDRMTKVQKRSDKGRAKMEKKKEHKGLVR